MAPATETPLWKLIVELLPEKDCETEWFSIAEIAPLLGLKPRSLLKHARDLWPNWSGHYRLDFGQAQSLIRRVAFAGKNVPARDVIERKLQHKRAALP